MKNKGITLVALVITIIILLILAGITISQLTGSGLFENAKLAEQKSKESQEKEDGILGDYENKIGQYIEGNRETVVIDKEEYSKLLKRIEALENANKTKNTHPILLVSAGLKQTNADTRPAGTYNASGSEYTRNNQNKMTEYLSFEEGKGWKVLKEGFYSISAQTYGTYSSEDGYLMGYLKINDSNIGGNWICKRISSADRTGHDSNQSSIYLLEGDYVDFSYVNEKALKYSSGIFYIYAMFE